MNKELLTLKETSAYLKLSVDNLYRMTSEKKIPFYKPGKLLLFDRIQLDQWLDEKAVKPQNLKNHE
jgi:excisionase family DNA binding protein